jgi:chemotaxis protein CheX
MAMNLINPFVASVNSIMPQLGFSNIQSGEPVIITNRIVDTGVIIIVGIVGDIKGNVAYKMSFEGARKIASTMMMFEVPADLDDMSQSALSEMTNMLTATAVTELSNSGIKADISTPTMLQGNRITLKMSTDNVTCIRFTVDDVVLDVHIALEG